VIEKFPKRQVVVRWGDRLRVENDVSMSFSMQLLSPLP
jgi:hypothetical protein